MYKNISIRILSISNVCATFFLYFELFLNTVLPRHANEQFINLFVYYILIRKSLVQISL